MIWALLAVAIAAAAAGGAGGKDVLQAASDFWRREIKKRFRRDPQTRDKAMAIVDAYDQTVDDMNTAMTQRMVETQAIHANYASTIADYEAVIERGGQDIQTMLDRFIELTTELRDTIGDEQYDDAYKKVQLQTAKYRKQQYKDEAREERKAARKGG